MSLNTTAHTTVSQPNRIPDTLVRIDHGSAYTIPTWAKQIKVTAGMAWISYDGIDIILPAGETLTISDTNVPLILSPLESAAVTLYVMK